MVSDIRFVLYYAHFPILEIIRRTKGTVELRIRFVGPDRWSRSTTGRNNGSRGILFSLEVVRLNTTYDNSDNGPVKSDGEGMSKVVIELL